MNSAFALIIGMDLSFKGTNTLLPVRYTLVANLADLATFAFMGSSELGKTATPGRSSSAICLVRCLFV